MQQLPATTATATHRNPLHEQHFVAVRREAGRPFVGAVQHRHGTRLCAHEHKVVAHGMASGDLREVEVFLLHGLEEVELFEHKAHGCCGPRPDARQGGWWLEPGTAPLTAQLQLDAGGGGPTCCAPGRGGGGLDQLLALLLLWRCPRARAGGGAFLLWAPRRPGNDPSSGESRG